MMDNTLELFKLIFIALIGILATLTAYNSIHIRYKRENIKKKIPKYPFIALALFFISVPIYYILFE